MSQSTTHQLCLEGAIALWVSLIQRHYSMKSIYEVHHGKTNNVVSELVQHKLACTVTETG